MWVGFLIVAVIAVFLFKRNRSWANGDLPVQRKSRIFSNAERTFFDTILEDLGDEFYVLSNVAFMDVIEPISSATNLETKGVHGMFANQFLDYVICKKLDLSIFGVIELENFEKNPNIKERKAREALISNVCKIAHLKLFYFDIRQDYKEVDVYRLITGRSRKKPKKKVPATEESQLSVNIGVDEELTRLKKCPKCHSEVVTKVAIKGSNIGEKFLMCRKYPYCDYQVTAEQAKQSQAIEEEKRQAQSGGFKDWA